VPYEFRAPEAIGEVEFGARGTHGQPPGTYTSIVDGLLQGRLRDDDLERAIGAGVQRRRRVSLVQHDHHPGAAPLNEATTPTVRGGP
jgi:hypothetical protein